MEKLRATCPLVLAYQTILPHPIAKVWPVLFQYNSWNPQHIGAQVRLMSGQPDQEGGLVEERKKGPDGYLAPILIETVRVIPGQKLVWRMFRKEVEREVTYVDFTLVDEGAETRFLYSSYGEIEPERFRLLPDACDYLPMLEEIFGALKTYLDRIDDPESMRDG